MQMMSEETHREYEEDMRQESMSQGAYMSEAVRQYASSEGAINTDCQWISTPFDTWERNPHYTGVDQPHPEDDSVYDYTDGNSYTYNDAPICWEGAGYYFRSAIGLVAERDWERVVDDQDHADLTARGYTLVLVTAEDIEIQYAGEAELTQADREFEHEDNVSYFEDPELDEIYR